MTEVVITRPIAYAFAERSYTEAQYLTAILNHYYGIESEFVDPSVKEQRVQQNAVRIEKILQLPAQSPVAHAVCAAYSRSLAARTLSDAFMPFAQKFGTSEKVEQVVLPMADAAARIFAPKSLVAESINYIRTLCNTAFANGTYSPEDMFMDDKLYAKLVKDNFTPLDYFRFGRKIIQNCTYENYRAIFTSNTSGVYSLFHPEVTPEISIPEAIMIYKGFDDDIRRIALGSRMGYRAFYIDRLRSIWGEGGMGLLPSEQLKELLRID